MNLVTLYLLTCRHEFLHGATWSTHATFPVNFFVPVSSNLTANTGNFHPLLFDPGFDQLLQKNQPRLSVKMVLFTMIARVADGLPLAASMQENEQVRMEYLHHHLIWSCCRKTSILWNEQVNRCSVPNLAPSARKRPAEISEPSQTTVPKTERAEP